MIQQVSPKGNQSWVFIGRTDAEAETPILWPPDVKKWLIGKDPDAEKDWRWEEKGMTEDKMVGWHHWLSGHEFDQALGVGDGQGGLACCSPWDRKKSDMTRWLNNNYFCYLNGETFLPTKVRLVKAMVFPVAVYGCESWTIKKAESWKNDTFEL